MAISVPKDLWNVNKWINWIRSIYFYNHILLSSSQNEIFQTKVAEKIKTHMPFAVTEFCWSCMYHIASRLVANDLIILWTPSLKYQNAGTWVWSLQRIFWVVSPPPCLLQCRQTFTFCFMNYYLYLKKENCCKCMNT